VTALQIAVASLDAFVMVAAASVVGNLLAGWIARWWVARRQDRALKRFVHANYIAALGVVRAPMPGGRCEHLRARELCDDCNEPTKRH